MCRSTHENGNVHANSKDFCLVAVASVLCTTARPDGGALAQNLLFRHALRVFNKTRKEKEFRETPGGRYGTKEKKVKAMYVQCAQIYEIPLQWDDTYQLKKE